ncbi:dTMP kinase [Gordonia terrae]|uniref:dTMP kinase n=1 Tax=Gordonia terrae TaxID=2055 RepID=UPI003F6D9C40
MGHLIAVEGIDGAGKNTLVTGLVNRWTAQGLRVTTFTFPRYGQSATADIAAEALHGSHGDLRGSVYAMALLFALDRAAAVDDIAAATADNDIVILDRYVASNAAYNAARLHQDATGEVAGWVADLEFGRFGLPVPDQHVLLGVPPEVAMRRAAERADRDATRARDAYELDDALQRRVDAVYRQLAEMGWASPWHRFDGEDIDSLAGVLTP